MRKTIFILKTLSIVLVFAACNKDKLIIESGSYSGTFKVNYNDTSMTGFTTLILNNSGYVCTGNPNRIPAGGSGTYTISNGKINFSDENIWTADFDWNLILNGTYDYTFDGSNLKIFAFKNNVGHYEYNLIKN